MTTLHPIAIVALRISGWQPSVWVAIAIVVALAGLPLPIAGTTLWLAAMVCIAMTKAFARMLDEQHSVRQRLEAERDRLTTQLAQHESQIVKLKDELDRARAACGNRQESDANTIYRRVGLHPQAPEFLVRAAQRAFRAALHPDRHPRFARQAHRRYLLAEATFEQIHELRR